VSLNKENENLAQAAKEKIQLLSLQLPDAEIKHEFIQLKERIKKVESKKSKQSLLAKRSLRRSIAGIAAAALLMMLAGWYFTGQDNFQEVITQMGETQTFQLPDGSTVELNANSHARFSSNWRQGQAREIWLSGEAFFSVTNQPQKGGKKFIVHTEKGDIIVLGTQFNVSQHRDRFEVVLTEGKIQLHQIDHPPLIMLPGQRAWLNEEQKLELEEVDIEPYTAWKKGRLLFKDMPIRRVVHCLQDDYGITLLVPNEKLLEKRVSANVKRSDPYALVEAIAALYQLKLNIGKDSLELTLIE
ncbi:MAG: FecR domain-containing protein, partial [Bacteroidota bacterium]